jgi:hypothetical protein
VNIFMCFHFICSQPSSLCFFLCGFKFRSNAIHTVLHRWGASGSNEPFRGGKASDWEGGVRVPLAVSGGLLPPSARGKKATGLAHVSDWYKTFASLAGASPEDTGGPSPMDSIDLVVRVYTMNKIHVWDMVCVTVWCWWFSHTS